VDVTGQSGSTAPVNGNGHHDDGYPAGGWGEGWSGAGSALEPEADSVVPAWRRGMDALNEARAQTPPRYAELLADAGVRPQHSPDELPEDEDAPIHEAHPWAPEPVAQSYPDPRSNGDPRAHTDPRTQADPRVAARFDPQQPEPLRPGRGYPQPDSHPQPAIFHSPQADARPQPDIFQQISGHPQPDSQPPADPAAQAAPAAEPPGRPQDGTGYPVPESPDRQYAEANGRSHRADALYRGDPHGVNGHAPGLQEPTPPQGTPSPFARLLDVPSVPSAPPAPRASTYPPPPVAPPPVAPAQQSPAPAAITLPAYHRTDPTVPADLDEMRGPGLAERRPERPEPAADPVPHASAPASLRPLLPAAFIAPPVLEPDPREPETPPQPYSIAGQAALPAAPPRPVDQLGPGHERFGQGAGQEHRAAPENPGPGRSTPERPIPDRNGHEQADHGGFERPGHGPERGGPDREPRRPARPAPVDAPPAEAELRHRADPLHGLPQRVPSEPDVPRIPEPTTEPPAPAPALSRIASGLRRDDVPPSDRPDGFDVAAVLSAVRDVPGVRDAQLRATATGGHTLRLDLADGSDPAYVSRVVARMLNERMGLVAEPPAGGERPTPPDERLAPQAEEPRGPSPEPVVRRAAAPPVPTQPSGPPYTPDRPFGPPGAADRGPFPPQIPQIPPVQRGGPPLPPGLIPASAAPREPRRRHPVTMRGRYPNDLRPGVDRFGRPDDQPESGRSPALTPPPEPARVVLDHVQVSTFGLDATVEVRLVTGERVAFGVANGPAVDGYVLRLCAAAAANAVDELLGEAAAGEPQGRGHCYVEQAAIVPMGGCEVAVVVVLLVCDGFVEQLAGSALVSGDPRQAVVRATLAAVNRRLTALLP
jgi:hypothetical protein